MCGLSTGEQHWALLCFDFSVCAIVLFCRGLRIIISFLVCSKEECALHAAVANSDSSVVRLLLKAGADPHQKGKK